MPATALQNQSNGIFRRVAVVLADFRRGRLLVPVLWQGRMDLPMQLCRDQMRFIGSTRSDTVLRDQAPTAWAAMLEYYPDMVPDDLRHSEAPIVVSIAPRGTQPAKIAFWAVSL